MISEKMRELVRNYFPDASNKFCDYILWEHTPFPVSTDMVEIECFIKKVVV